MAGQHILVVDDEADLIWAIAHSLRDAGFQVSTASDGIEALVAAARTPPDLIVLDVSMPRLDGWQVCESLRRDPHLATVPILFLSGHVSVEERLRGFELGGDDYLAKPFDLRELRARINALLRRPQPPTALSSSALLNPQALAVGSVRLELQRGEVVVGERRATLTPAELELLRFLLLHPDQTFSGSELLRRVWGYEPDAADPSLVRWHVMNLRAKIEQDPQNPRYLQTVPRHGYILRSLTYDSAS